MEFGERSEKSPVSAPYMSVHTFMDTRKDYVSFCSDWRCIQDAENTYWAIHCWYDDKGHFTNIAHGSGYAGFQNIRGRHAVILSIWDTGCGRPVIEYGENTGNEKFSGEGTGVHVITPYPWKCGTWYSMQISVVSDGTVSRYFLFVREAGKEWKKIAVIRLPRPGLHLLHDVMFQEDFGRNNYARSCMLRNIYARTAGSSQWEACREIYVTNHDLIDKGRQNFRYDCDIRVLDDDREIWLQCGGAGYQENCSVPLPAWFPLFQPPQPNSPAEI